MDLRHPDWLFQEIVESSLIHFLKNLNIIVCVCVCVCVYIYII